MSRATKWKLDNTKVKVVFRLQFLATHIPQSGWDKLFITFISVESGKATAKTTKANVRNGTCKWTDPIYETTRLLQDSKSKQYEEKLYKLVIAMGSSRATILGEATVNLAEFADALKPCIISLPLYGCDFGTTLHVTVQLLTSKTGFREFEQQREFMEKGLQSDQTNPDEFSGGKNLLNEALTKNQEVSRSKLKEKSKELNPNEEDSALTTDADSNKSYKHNTADSALVSPDVCDYRFSIQGASDWSRRRTSESAGDAATAAEFDENAKLRGYLEAAELSIIELKSEIDSLQSYTDQINKEAQDLSSQLSSEISSAFELANQVSDLKSECSKLSAELEEFKLSNSYHVLEQQRTLQDLRRGWVNGIAILEEKALDIRNKTSPAYREREYRFPHSELEAMLAILQNLKQECVIGTCDSLGANESDRFRYDLDLYQPDLGTIHCLNSQVSDSKMFELLQEVDESKAENVSLKNKMDQMECYYEALVQELEENQKQLISELQNLKDDHSTSMYVASTAKTEMEAICINMNEQIMQLSEDKRDLIGFNEKLEKRATAAEAALKRAKLNYTMAVNHLQKDLDLLSSQVRSMFETSDGLVRLACTSLDLQNPKEVTDCRFDDIYFEVFYTVLKETVREEVANSNAAKEVIRRKLESSVDEILFLNEYIGRFREESQSTIQNIENEKSILSGRVDEYETLVTLYQRKLEDLVEEKTQLTYLLENECVTRGKLEAELEAMKRSFESSNILAQNFLEKLEVFGESFLDLAVIEDELLKIAGGVLLSFSDTDGDEMYKRTIAAEIKWAYFCSELKHKAHKYFCANGKLSEAEELISELMSWNVQMNFKLSLLEEKLEDQRGKFDELQLKYDEVKLELYDQTMKTEEIASISQRLKEQNRDKKEAISGETLRMAFMKEQHEELTQQATISKKQSEDMLMKLQNMVNETEDMKKSEAVLIRKNEELGMHILDLEAELQTILAENRVKVNAYDEMESQNMQLKLDLNFVKSILEKTKPDTTNQPAEFLFRTQELKQSIKDMIAYVSKGNHYNGDTRCSAVGFKSSIAKLTEEVEKMRNYDEENSLTVYQKFPELQDELLHLNRANEQLSTLFPVGPENSNNSALKRVLSFEINLAEQLQSNAVFKNCEETMLKSFVDINDLIKETLEIKRNHTSLESELQEMHDRYTELSLKFAEVEGERQKLMMSLKISNRTAKKLH